MKNRDVQINFVQNTHITNVGNAFLDIGSEMSIRMATPSAVIYRSSAFPTWFADQSSNNGFLDRRFGTRATLNSSFFHLAERVHCEFAVFSGMIMTARFVRRYGPLILRMRERGIRLILNGVGPANYNAEELGVVRKFWRECGLYGLISRDRYTYENYAEAAEHAYDGIDCGFFLRGAVSLPSLECGEYVALTFDSGREPIGVATGKDIVRLHHQLYPRPIGRSLQELRKTNSFISEQAIDYLTLYCNATEVHADRIHACVAAVAFGTPFQLYSDSRRSLLFERIGLSLDDIRRRVTIVEEGKMVEERKTQIGFLRRILAK